MESSVGVLLGFALPEVTDYEADGLLEFGTLGVAKHMYA
jgi:hypothetical protein